MKFSKKSLVAIASLVSLKVIAAASMLVVTPSMTASAGGIHNGYEYDACSSNAKLLCDTVTIHFIDVHTDMRLDFKETKSKDHNTFLDRLEVSLSENCQAFDKTDDTNKRLRQARGHMADVKGTINLSSRNTTMHVPHGDTMLTRTWILPVGCKWHLHARHPKTVGKDRIYTDDFYTHYAMEDVNGHAGRNDSHVNGAEVCKVLNIGSVKKEVVGCEFYGIK